LRPRDRGGQRFIGIAAGAGGRIPARQRAQRVQGTARAGVRIDGVAHRAERKRADAIATSHAGPRQPRGRTRRRHGLVAHTRTETHRRMGVDQQQQAALTFGFEQFRVPFPAACGTSPVDVARVVPRLVDTRLGVVHAAPAQRRDMPTGQRRSCTRTCVARLARACAQRDQLRQIDAGDAVYGR